MRNKIPQSTSRQGRRAHDTITVKIVAVVMFCAGILHVVAAPERFRASAPVGVLFLLLAAGQIAFAVLTARRPSQKLWLVGLWTNTSLLALWALSQALPHIAGAGREPLSALSLVRKLLELITVILILFLIKKPDYTKEG